VWPDRVEEQDVADPAEDAAQLARIEREYAAEREPADTYRWWLDE
jgi:hypothetical protein